jgi:hypothetical protein
VRVDAHWKTIQCRFKQDLLHPALALYKPFKRLRLNRTIPGAPLTDEDPDKLNLNKAGRSGGHINQSCASSRRGDEDRCVRYRLKGFIDCQNPAGFRLEDAEHTYNESLFGCARLGRAGDRDVAVLAAPVFGRLAASFRFTLRLRWP